MSKIALLITATTVAVAGIAQAAPVTTLYSTGFESSQGFTSGSQLSTNANWTGDGQDTTGWAISTAVVAGSGPHTGAQYVLASSPTGSVPTRFNWTVTPVTDFSGGSIITESASVKIANPTAGTISRSTVAGLQMYDAGVNLIGQLSVFDDVENLVGQTDGGHYYIEQDFSQDDQTANPGFIYDLGPIATTTGVLNTYFDLAMSVDFNAMTISASVDGVALDGTGVITSTDFHDADIILARASTTTGGTAGRGGFDDYSVTQATATPEPASLSALLGGVALVSRRRRSR